MILSRRASEVFTILLITNITVLIHHQYSNLGKKKATLPPMETKPSSEDILNAILPPREWVENGIHYLYDCIRKTLYLVCESLTSIKSRCC